jgi:hypothetical protein
MPSDDKLLTIDLGWINPFEVAPDLPWAKRILPTGSFYICRPQVRDTDRDYVVLVEDLEVAHVQAKAGGWHESIADSEEYDLQADGGFYCYRKGEYNLVVTTDESFFLKFWDATHLAALLGLNEKAERITLFKYVLYGTIGEDNG